MSRLMDKEYIENLSQQELGALMAMECEWKLKKQRRGKYLKDLRKNGLGVRGEFRSALLFELKCGFGNKEFTSYEALKYLRKEYSNDFHKLYIDTNGGNLRGWRLIDFSDRVSRWVEQLARLGMLEVRLEEKFGRNRKIYRIKEKQDEEIHNNVPWYKKGWSALLRMWSDFSRRGESRVSLT